MNVLGGQGGCTGGERLEEVRRDTEGEHQGKLGWSWSGSGTAILVTSPCKCEHLIGDVHMFFDVCITTSCCRARPRYLAISSC